MPPKAARGRGRGRAGGSSGTGAGRSVTAREAQPDPEPASSQPSDAAAATTQQNEPSSPSSPATIPTETPAPTPARVPPQRTPSNASRPPATTSKFKPKAIRRGQSEREEIARKELLEQQKKEEAGRAAKEKAAGLPSIRGGKSTRSRGGAMGRGRDTGLFGITPGALEHGSRPVELLNVAQKMKYTTGGPKVSDFYKDEEGEPSRGGHSSGGGGGDGGGRSSGSKGRSFEPQYPVLDGDDLSVPRVDIEHINIADDSDDEVIVTGSRKVDKGKSAARSSGLRPVRLHRVEHKERVTTVNTAPETQAEIKADPKSAAQDDDSDIPMADEERSAAPTRTLMDEFTASHIKSEPVEDNSLPPLVGPPSPETQRKVKGKGKEPASPEIKKKKAVSKKRDEKPVLQTEEDHAEYERYLVDAQVLANELGGMQARSQPSGGDTAMAGTEEEANDKKAGRLYLFQFPGVLTKLYNPLTKPKTKSKPEKDEDLEITSSTSKPPKKQPTVKVEDGDGEVIIKKEEEEAPRKTDDVVDEVGAVGRMVVRKSGRVEITWGDTDMLVQRGTETGFLGTGYIVDSMDRMPVAAADGKKLGVSTAMGMMMGKFVVVPDFEKTW